MSSIKLSSKHGVNPSMDICFYCQEVKQLLLMGRLPYDKEAPRQVCTSLEPCDACKEKFETEKAVVIVEATQDSKGISPTGRYIGLTEEGARRILNEDFVNDVVSRGRIALIEPSLYNQLGFEEAARQLENDSLEKIQKVIE